MIGANISSYSSIMMLVMGVGRAVSSGWFSLVITHHRGFISLVGLVSFSPQHNGMKIYLNRFSLNGLEYTKNSEYTKLY